MIDSCYYLIEHWEKTLNGAKKELEKLCTQNSGKQSSQSKILKLIK